MKTTICVTPDDSRKLASSDNTVDEIVKDTVRMLSFGIQSSKKGWQSILIGALLLNWLRMEHSAQGKRNDLGPRNFFSVKVFKVDLEAGFKRVFVVSSGWF